MGSKESSPKIEFFHSCDLDLDPMTFIYELDLDIIETYLYAKNEVRRSRRSKVIHQTLKLTLTLKFDLELDPMTLIIIIIIILFAYNIYIIYLQ